MSGPRRRDPAVLGAALAAALRRALAALARIAAFSALLALPMTFVLHAGYGLAFLFTLGAAAALEFGRAALRRAAPRRAAKPRAAAQRAFPAACGKPEAWNERS
jgi:uncharacterized membrane protein YdfJ with MMPL/SSD domain